MHYLHPCLLASSHCQLLGALLPPTVDLRNSVKSAAGLLMALPAYVCASSCAFTTQTKQEHTLKKYCSVALLVVKKSTG